LFFLSLFYNRQQFALRTAILYSGSQIGNACGGLFAIAILNLEGVRGIDGWRWLFIVEGALTVGLAIIFAFLLPNSNKKIIGLSDLEIEWVQWNFEKDLGQQDSSDDATAWQGLKMAARDPKTWLLMSILYLCYIVGTVVNFFPSVVSTLGYDRNTTYALTAPPFLLCVFCMLANGFHSDKVRIRISSYPTTGVSFRLRACVLHQFLVLTIMQKQERFYHIVCPFIITVIANIIAVSTLNTGARYLAMMLLPGSFYSSAVVILSWITGSLNQPKVKRASAIALINVSSWTVCDTLYLTDTCNLRQSAILQTSGPVTFTSALPGISLRFVYCSQLVLVPSSWRVSRGCTCLNKTRR